MMVVDEAAVEKSADRARKLVYQLAYYLWAATDTDAGSAVVGMPRLKYLFRATEKGRVGADRATVLVFDALPLPLSAVREWLPEWRDGEENEHHRYYAHRVAKAVDHAARLDKKGLFNMPRHFDYQVFAGWSVMLDTDGKPVVGGDWEGLFLFTTQLLPSSVYRPIATALEQHDG